MKWVTDYLAKKCCGMCKEGSFEQAYHKLQKAPDKMDDSLIMFEAGKLAAKSQRNSEIKAKINKAINKALPE